MRVPFAVRVTSNELTGVAKSTTSKRFAYASGSVVFGKSTTIRPPSCFRLAWTRGSLVLTRILPAPSAPRRKSTLSMAAADFAVAGWLAPGAAALVGAAAAKLPPRPTVT